MYPAVDPLAKNDIQFQRWFSEFMREYVDTIDMHAVTIASMMKTSYTRIYQLYIHIKKGEQLKLTSINPKT